MKKIVFCRLNDPYGEFSNFYKSKMIVDGKEYLTVEHFYQSKKFEGTVFEDYVRHQLSPKGAKILAYTKEGQQYLNPDWDKIYVMARGLFAKFRNPILKNLLLSTGDAKIVEYSTKDFFWGTDETEHDDTGNGQNHLGQMLMELRTKIQENETRNFI